jgi:hypothetical protein
VELTSEHPWDPQRESDETWAQQKFDANSPVRLWENEFVYDPMERVCNRLKSSPDPDLVLTRIFDVKGLDHRVISGMSSEASQHDWDKLQACFGWKPIDRIKTTLLNTTQLAKNVIRLPMRQHFKTRYYDLNVRRLQEVYATDTLFSSEKSIEGYNCAQLYAGKSSRLLALYGMRSENQMPETLEDFVREVGAPKGLLSDNAKSETSKEVKRIQRKYTIQDSQTEPHHPNQNYAERCIQEVKGTTNLIMDRTGAAPALWFLCMA